jgi:uncharacterized phage protein (TIGR01671 family)
MREIEFRGWDVEWNRWVYGYYEKISVGIGQPLELIHVFMDWNLSSSRKIAHGSMGQWTGLYDRNNKKIFEGDIVAYDEHYSGDHRIKAGKLTVIFDEGGFDLDYSNGYMVESLAHLVLNNYCEVVGNIKETP